MLCLDIAKLVITTITEEGLNEFTLQANCSQNQGV